MKGNRENPKPSGYKFRLATVIYIFVLHSFPNAPREWTVHRRYTKLLCALRMWVVRTPQYPSRHIHLLSSLLDCPVLQLESRKCLHSNSISPQIINSSLWNSSTFYFIQLFDSISDFYIKSIEQSFVSSSHFQ